MTDHNYFSFTGRLTRDCRLNYTNNGTPVVEFSVAVNKKYKEKEFTNFFDVNLWGNLGVALQKYLVKGQQVLCAGEMKQEKWQKDDQLHYKIKFIATHVQLLGTKNHATEPVANETAKPDEDIPF